MSAPAPQMGAAPPDSYFTRGREEILPLVPAGPLRLLDVGCGAGATLEAIRARETVAWAGGVELEPGAAERAERRFDRLWREDVQGFDPGAEIAPGSLDLILCLDVLEHLPDPWAVVRRLSPLLRPGGRLIVSVPNIRNWKFIRGLLLRGDFHYREAGLLDRTHLRFFVHETAAELAACGGLRVIRAGSATPYGRWELRRWLIALTGGRLEKLIAKQIVVVAESDGAA